MTTASPERRGPVQIRGRLTVLRPFIKSDITPRYIAWLNDPAVVQYSRQRFASHTYESCCDYLAACLTARDFFLAIESHTSGDMIGTITAHVSADNASADLGILVGDRAVWGTGVATDAWSALMAYLLNECGIRQITGGTLSANRAMQRVMEKSGMRLVSTELIQERHGDPCREAFLFALVEPTRAGALR